MDLQSVRKVASGRVWSGIQAKENGLVDVLGSYEDAVTLAAEKAGISDDYRVSVYPRQQPFIQELVNRLTEEVKVRWQDPSLKVFEPYLEEMDKLNSMQGIQARLPFELQH